MGKTQSKPETPEGPVESGSVRPIPSPRNPFLREPWRTIKGWDESTRDDMKSEIMSLKTTPLHGVPTFNIILTGQIGAGKSSFYNSINSIFSNFVRPTKAAAGLRTLTTVAKGYLENQVDAGRPTKLNDSQQEEGPTPLVKEMEKESEKTPTEVDESPMEL